MAEADFFVRHVSRTGCETGRGHGPATHEFQIAAARRGAEFQVNSHATGYQTGATVAGTPDGDFLVIWQSQDQDGSGNGVFARMIQVALFGDGFEAGDACAWSSAVGGGCP